MEETVMTKTLAVALAGLLTTASLPPGTSARSAAARPATSCPNSSLTQIRIAWKARVAGWLCPGFGRGRLA